MKMLMSVTIFFDGFDCKAKIVSMIKDLQLSANTIKKLISQNVCDQIITDLQKRGFSLLVLDK